MAKDLHCPFCDTKLDKSAYYRYKCETCNLCVTCCEHENHGLCDEAVNTR